MPDLSGFPALDVAIGLFFLYFLLSTVASSINEAIANLLGWRAKTLEDAIRRLVGDPKVKRGWKEWVGRVHKKGVTEEVESERDDVSVAADLAPSLTTVRLPMTDMGRMALTLALKPRSTRPRRRSTGHVLVVRDSTGPAPAR